MFYTGYQPWYHSVLWDLCFYCNSLNQERICRWTCFGLFIRFFFLPPCTTPIPFQPPTLGRRERLERLEAPISLDYFLLIRGVLGASLIFAVRICNFFFLFLLCARLLNNNKGPSTHTASFGSSIYILSGNSTEFQLTHNHRNSAAGKSWSVAVDSLKQPGVPHLCGQSEAARCPTPVWTAWSSPVSHTCVDSLKQPRVPHLGFKWKRSLKILLCFLQKPKLQNCHYRLDK